MGKSRAQLFTKALLALVLSLVTLAVFSPVRHYGFIDFDDDLYVTRNPRVNTGLTKENAIWAFTNISYGLNWHPLTWLSHMTDVQLFGLHPGGHHLISLLIHLVNVVFILVVLMKMTGAFYRSILVAVLFAIHPLHVESVAWIAERKDVLSAFFWWLTLWAYLRHVRKTGLINDLLPGMSFALGLMAKPMLVTLPFVLLLLDYWPLGRMRPHNRVRKKIRLIHLVGEKWLLFLLSACSGVVTYMVQRRGGVVGSLEAYSWWDRVGNALISYIVYIGKMLWPVNLAIFYPYEKHGIFQAIGAMILLAAISTLVTLLIKKHPYLPVGWLWFVGTLVPVIGLVQVGFASMADRYTYLPLVGLFIMVAWGAEQAVTRRLVSTKTVGVVSIAALSILVMVSRRQVEVWENNTSLYAHAVAVTNNNWLADNNLADALFLQGKEEEALPYYIAAIKIKPDHPQLARYFVEAHMRLGRLMLKEKRFEEAESQFELVLRVRPRMADTHHLRGVALLAMRKPGEALEEFRAALRLNPGPLVQADKELECLDRIDNDNRP